MGIKLIDFSASWCFPCKLQTPIIEKLEKKFKDVSFEEIDIDANREKAMKYEIRAVPTIILEKDGKELNRFVGVTAEKDLKKAIEKVIEK